MSPDIRCRSRYLYIVICGYLRILGAPSVQSCCTLWISASYSVFVYGSYRKSRLVCGWLSDLDLSRHHPILCGAVPAIQRGPHVRFAQNGKSGPHCGGQEDLTQFAKQCLPAVKAPRRL